MITSLLDSCDDPQAGERQEAPAPQRYQYWRHPQRMILKLRELSSYPLPPEACHSRDTVWR